MTFEQSLELAKVIANNPYVRIVAIGRFVSLEEVKQADGSDPWGISVIEIDAERPTVLWSEEQCEKFLESAIERHKPAKIEPVVLVQPALF